MNDSAPVITIDPVQAAARVEPTATPQPLAGPAEAKIDVRNLDFHYGKAHALRHVNFGVPANAVTAIIGPSGCGKSTLLRTINRIFEMYPDQRASGEI